MKQQSLRYVYPALLLILYAAGLLLAWPAGEFPLNDDWSYTKSVRSLLLENRIQIGDWAAMTVCTNIFWGGAFCKVFGFSFFILRFSSMVSAAAGLLLMYGLLRRMGAGKTGAFITTLTLLFNPYFFNLSTTFMTDVNFLVLLLAGIYCALRYRESHQTIWAVLLVLISVALVLVRQYGLVFPFCFILAAIFYREMRRSALLPGFVALLLSCIALWIFEKHISANLNPWAAYNYVVLPSANKQDFIGNLMEFLPQRLPTIISQILVYTAPCSIVVLISLWRSIPWRIIIGLALVAAAATIPVCISTAMFPGNVAGNMHVGAETFYQNSGMSATAPQLSNYSAVFQLFAENGQFILVFASLLGITFSLYRWADKGKGFSVGFDRLFIAVLSGSYIILIGVTQSYFDRYNLPLIALALLLISPVIITRKNSMVSLALILLLGYMSVGGTRDYFTINRQRWAAYYHTTRVLKADYHTVHGGFETKCWDEGNFSWWQNQGLQGNDYLIQFDPEPGFLAIKAYPFQRVFPPRGDTLYVFKRTND